MRHGKKTTHAQKFCLLRTRIIRMVVQTNPPERRSCSTNTPASSASCRHRLGCDNYANKSEAAAPPKGTAALRKMIRIPLLHADLHRHAIDLHVGPGRDEKVRLAVDDPGLHLKAVLWVYFDGGLFRLHHEPARVNEVGR